MVEARGLERALARAKPEGRLKLEAQFEKWKKLHAVYEASQTAARERPADVGRQLVAALVRGDRRFQGMPIFAWIRKNGLAVDQVAALESEYARLARASRVAGGTGHGYVYLRIDSFIKAFTAGEERAALLRAVTPPLGDKHIAHDTVQLLEVLVPSPFRRSALEGLRAKAEGLCADFLWIDVHGKATTFAAWGSELQKRWRRAQERLEKNPKDTEALHIKARRLERMAAEADLFGETQRAQECRKKAVEALDFVVSCGNRDALWERARLNEDLENYKLAVEDIDRLVASPSDHDVRGLADLKKRRAKLAALAAAQQEK